MKIQDIIAKAFERYPEAFEIVQHGPFFDHTGEDMSDFEEDVNERPRIAYIFGYADALGIFASHIHLEIYKYKQGLRRKDNNKK